MPDKPRPAPRTARLHERDNLVVAVDPVLPGSVMRGAKARDRIPKGHKMAFGRMAQGEPILKVGQIIGFASKPVEPGEWLHEHNVEMHALTRGYRFAEDAESKVVLPIEARTPSQGYRRTNGKVGTRNYLAILASANCSPPVARFLACEIERSSSMLHHGVRLCLWPQADADDQARNQQRCLPPDDRRHGRQLRRCSRRRPDCLEGPGNLRDDPEDCLRERSKSGLLGYGDVEFPPWQIDAVM